MQIVGATDPQRTAATLAQLERVIESGLQTFVEVGLALLEIRDRRLYREGWTTFEDYCQERWQMGRRHANRMIESAEVASILGPMGPIPTNERQARELAPLKDDPVALTEAWQEVQERAAEEARETGELPKITATDVREAVEKRVVKPQAIAHVERREAIAQEVQARVAEAEAAVEEVLPFGRIVQSDALAFLRALPAACADLCVTSPPYWAKRVYGAGDDEIGDEEAPDEYLALLRLVCQEIGRVLTPEGWLLLNIGDTYASKPGQYRGDPARVQGISDKARLAAQSAPASRQWDVPDKSLVLVPWRLVADLVMRDGWRCRNVIAWHKLGHQPENVFDRLTQAWEPVFALTRGEYPYYNRQAIEERPVDVWTLPVGRQGEGGEHPAVFPSKLVERAIHLACPSGGVVLDPFAGSGTVMAVAGDMGRKFLGCDLIDWTVR